jgi:hypothetical protein
MIKNKICLRNLKKNIDIVKVEKGKGVDEKLIVSEGDLEE